MASHLFLLKLALAPAMVGTISLLGQRLGPRVAGLLSALPVVGGPTLMFFALEQGPDFASHAAYQSLSGIFSLSAYAVSYAGLAYAFRQRSRLWIGPVLLLAWGVFGLLTALFQRVGMVGPGNLFLAIAGIGLGLRALAYLGRHVEPAKVPAPATPDHLPAALGLILRMAAAALMVAGLTEAAHWLGPQLAGLLTPFPVASTVLLVAEHWGSGPAAAGQMVRGFLVGLLGFAAFCFCVASALPALGTLPAFALGLAAVAASQLGIHWRAGPSTQ